jgi:hypothetical protein
MWTELTTAAKTMFDETVEGVKGENHLIAENQPGRFHTVTQ